MKGLEVRLTGSLEPSNLPKDIKIKVIHRMLKHTGNFVGSDSWMINLPFKIPFVNYWPARINMGEITSTNYFCISIKDREIIYATKRLFGYQLG